MDCKETQQQLNRGEGSLGLRVHLALCGRCRNEYRARRRMEKAISGARPELPAALLNNILAAAKQEAAPIPCRLQSAPWRGRRNRLAFWLVWAMIAALLAAGLAVAYVVTRPKKVKKPAPTAPVVEIAPVPYTGNSLYIKIPTNLQYTEIWMTPGAYYLRDLSLSGKLQLYLKFEPETNTFCLYVPASKQQIVMDLMPVMSDALQIMPGCFNFNLDLDNIKLDRNRRNATVEYDTPKPDWVDRIEAPPGTETITATAKIKINTLNGRKSKSVECWIGDKFRGRIVSAPLEAL
jgi:hypothetical protein